ncbi:transposase IS5 [Saccharopolyspora erythraea D]|nr:transposase IS5 [Saccharopolyspora erythraea D]
MIIDAGGVPLAVSVTGGNRHDSTRLIPLVEALPTIRGKRGRPWQRPRWLYGDRGYDYDHHRKALRDRGIVPRIARENTVAHRARHRPCPSGTAAHAPGAFEILQGGQQFVLDGVHPGAVVWNSDREELGEDLLRVQFVGETGERVLVSGERDRGHDGISHGVHRLPVDWDDHR